MSTNKLFLATFGVIMLAAAIALTVAAPVTFADATCTAGNTRTIAVDDGWSAATGGDTHCFRIDVPNGSPLFSVDLSVDQGQFDLYLKRGSSAGPLTSREHKLNFFPVRSGDSFSTFVVENPEPGTYTLAVDPRGSGSGEYYLSTSSGLVGYAGNSPSNCPPDADYCTHVSPLIIAGIAIGPQSGSRAVLPIDVACAGQIEATANWMGQADQLSLVLYGPEGVGEVVRRQGSQPLQLSYRATAGDVQQGTRWWISLENYSGHGVIGGRVDIKTPDAASCAPSLNKAFDFKDQAGNASWRNDQGERLPYPGADNDRRGFARAFSRAALEDGRSYADVLQAHPRWASRGTISGSYQVTVPVGGRFRADVGFLLGASGSDGATFGVSFAPKPAPGLLSLVESVGSLYATYDGRLDSMDLDLSPWAGQEGTLILYVEAGASSGQDWAVWVNPRLEGASLRPLIAVMPLMRNSVSGKVFWNTQGVAGATVLLKESNSYTATTLASATTDSSGKYTIVNPPAGTHYLYVEAPSKAYWKWAGAGKITVAANGETIAQDLYLSKVMQLLSPANNATGVSRTPVLRWQAVPGAATYSVSVYDKTAGSAVFRVRGLSDTAVRVSPALAPGHRYEWFVDAYNPAGKGIAYYSSWYFATD